MISLENSLGKLEGTGPHPTFFSLEFLIILQPYRLYTSYSKSAHLALYLAPYIPYSLYEKVREFQHFRAVWQVAPHQLASRLRLVAAVTAPSASGTSVSPDARRTRTSLRADSMVRRG